MRIKLRFLNGYVKIGSFNLKIVFIRDGNY